MKAFTLSYREGGKDIEIQFFHSSVTSTPQWRKLVDGEIPFNTPDENFSLSGDYAVIAAQDSLEAIQAAE